MHEGILYALVNEAMPGYVKIGMTSRTVQDRMKELYTTGVPLPFQCIAAKRVSNVEEKEATIHRIFQEYRTPNREFFRIPTSKALDLFSLIHGENVHDLETCHINAEITVAARQGLCWGYDEQEKLLQEVQQGVPHAEIASSLERSVGAVVARLKYIATNMILDGKSYQEAVDVTRLPMAQIEEAVKERKRKGQKTTFVKVKPS